MNIQLLTCCHSSSLFQPSLSPSKFVQSFSSWVDIGIFLGRGSGTKLSVRPRYDGRSGTQARYFWFTYLPHCWLCHTWDHPGLVSVNIWKESFLRMQDSTAHTLTELVFTPGCCSSKVCRCHRVLAQHICVKIGHSDKFALCLHQSVLDSVYRVFDTASVAWMCKVHTNVFRMAQTHGSRFKNNEFLRLIGWQVTNGMHTVSLLMDWATILHSTVWNPS